VIFQTVYGEIEPLKISVMASFQCRHSGAHSEIFKKGVSDKGSRQKCYFSKFDCYYWFKSEWMLSHDSSFTMSAISNVALLPKGRGFDLQNLYHEYAYAVIVITSPKNITFFHFRPFPIKISSYTGVLWNFIEHSSDEVIQNVSIRNS